MLSAYRKAPTFSGSSDPKDFSYSGTGRGSTNQYRAGGAEKVFRNSPGYTLGTDFGTDFRGDVRDSITGSKSGVVALRVPEWGDRCRALPARNAGSSR